MSELIERRTIPTGAGNYTVSFYYDESPSQPYDEGFVLAVDGYARYGYDSCIDIKHGDIPDEVWSVLKISGQNREDSWDWELTSGAALVRYLRLKGYKGVTLVNRNYQPVEPSTNRRERIHGVAWENSAVSGQYDEAAARHNVEIDLDEWRAWAEGDVFGYVVTDPSGEEVEDGSCWGYFGLERERDYVLSEARDAAEYDAKARSDQANLVGAGIVGLI